MSVRCINKIRIYERPFTTDQVIAASIMKMANPLIEFVPASKTATGDSISLTLENLEDLSNNRFHDSPALSLTEGTWEAYGKEILFSRDIENVFEAEDMFRRRYYRMVEKTYVDDLEPSPKYREHSLLMRLNPTKKEILQGTTTYLKQFIEAVELGTIVVENWIRAIKEDVDYRSIENRVWQDAEEKEEDGVFVLEKMIPWQYQVKKHPDTKAKIIIFKSRRNGYNVVSKSSDELKIKDSEYLKFLHPSGFMGVANTLDDAINAAKATISSLSCA